MQLKRRQARVNAFITIFESSFGTGWEEVVEIARQEAPEYEVDKFGEDLIRYYYSHSEEIDAKIESKLKGWKVSRLPRVNLSILRLAVSEMMQDSVDMDSVYINEAVEISKIYGDESDYQFINGVLGSISKDRREALNITSEGDKQGS